MEAGTETKEAGPKAGSGHRADSRRQAAEFAAEYLDLWEAQVTSVALQGAVSRPRPQWTRR